MNRRWLKSIVLVAALMVFLPTANADVTYYTDGFESYDLGYDPDPPAVSIADSGNWVFTDGDQTAGVVNTKYYSGSKSYSIGSYTDSWVDMATNNKIPAEKGTVHILVVNTKVWLGETDSLDNFSLRIYGRDQSNPSDIAGIVCLESYGDNNVYIRYYTNGAYSSKYLVSGSLLSKWLDVTVTFDLEDETYACKVIDTTDDTVLVNRTGLDYGVAEAEITQARFVSAQGTSTNDREQYIDDVNVYGVPEPASLLFLTCGAAGLLLRKRR